MAKREKFTATLKCPSCGRAGVAAMSEEAGHKIETDYGTTVDDVPEGFKAVLTPMDRERGYDILCADCGVSVLGSKRL